MLAVNIPTVASAPHTYTLGLTRKKHGFVNDGVLKCRKVRLFCQKVKIV